MKRRSFVYLILNAIVTIAVFYWFFQVVSVKRVYQVMLGVPIYYYLLFIFSSVLMSFFRALRYKVLLSANLEKVSWGNLFWVVLARNFFSDLLPARIGSLSYVYLVVDKLKVKAENGFGSFSLAFLFDGLVLGILVLIAAWSAVTTHLVSPIYFVLFSILLFFVSLMLILNFSKILSYVNFVFKKFFKKRGKSIQKFLQNLSNSVKEVEEKKIFFKVFVISFIVRVLKYTGLFIILLGMLQAVSGTVFALSDGFKLLLIIYTAELSASLPVSGVGGFGLYEAVSAAGLLALNFSEENAYLVSIAYHFFTQLWGAILCSAALLALSREIKP